MFGRERPALAQLLDPVAALDALRKLHAPMRGTLRAPPGGKQWCTGCGGTVRWPCITRRILDGEPASIAHELETTGSPLHIDDDQEATA